MRFTFGKRSEEQLSTMHPDLQLIFREALRYSQVDFGITEGHRSPTRQFELFKQGRIQDANGKWVVVGKVLTTIDGFEKKGKHNLLPSQAGDIYIHVPGRQDLAYNEVHLATVAGAVICTARRLKDEGKISTDIRWGADWDSDGQLLYDQRFDDMPHFELIF